MKPISRSKLGKKIIDKTQDSIENSLAKRIKLDREIKELDKKIIKERSNNKLVENKLRTAAKDNKAIVIDVPSGVRDSKGKPIGNATINLRNPKEKEKLKSRIKFNKEELKELEDSTDAIRFNKESGGNSALAHEIGHVINRNSKGKAAKIDKEAEKIIEEFHKPADSPRGRDNSKGLWKSVGRFFKGKKVVNNEKNASRNAIKLLKESGADENELKLAKESLGKSLESYKEEHKMYYKSPFINKLQSLRKDKEK